MARGRQRSWLGVTAAASKLLMMVSTGKSSGWKGSCVTEGRMRYSHVRWLLLTWDVVSNFQSKNGKEGSEGWVGFDGVMGQSYPLGAVKAVPDSCSA